MSATGVSEELWFPSRHSWREAGRNLVVVHVYWRTLSNGMLATSSTGSFASSRGFSQSSISRSLFPPRTADLATIKRGCDLRQ